MPTPRYDGSGSAGGGPSVSTKSKVGAVLFTASPRQRAYSERPVAMPWEAHSGEADTERLAFLPRGRKKHCLSQRRDEQSPIALAHVHDVDLQVSVLLSCQDSSKGQRCLAPVSCWPPITARMTRFRSHRRLSFLLKMTQSRSSSSSLISSSVTRSPSIQNGWLAVTARRSLTTTYPCPS